MATEYSSLHTARPWQPGALRRIPWAGISSLLGALIGIGAAVAILIISDGVPIREWMYAPTVYLSVCYTISNILLNAALSQGVTITWWRKAMGTAQLGDLHRYWDFGNSPLASIMAGRHFNFIACAALFVALAPINGPLLQRASSTVVDTIESPRDASLPVARSLMDYSFPTAFLSTRGYMVAFTTQAYTPAVEAFYNADPITATNTGCASDGVCRGRLPAAGLAINCSSELIAFDIGTEMASTNLNVTLTGINAFSSSFNWSYGFPANFSLNVQFKAQSPCSGNLIAKSCSLRAATVQYPVVIDGNKSTISLDPQSTIYDDYVEEISTYETGASATSEGFGQPMSAIGGYVYALQNRFNSVAHLNFAGAIGYEIYASGSTAPQFGNTTEAMAAEQSDPFAYLCNIKYSDPTDYLLQQARELMFRTAIAAGNSSRVQTVLQSSQIRTVRVYRSNYLFLSLAVAVSLLAVLIVLGTFNGYWLLGRNMTMSPLEIARAFNAPLLAAQDSNAEAKELVERIGSKAARYGAVSTVRFEEHGKYGGQLWENGILSQLEIKDPAFVQTPIIGR